MNEVLLDQIPSLMDLQRYLEQLAIMEPPAIKKDIILEQVSFPLWLHLSQLRLKRGSKDTTIFHVRNLCVENLGFIVIFLFSKIVEILFVGVKI